jgi:hypothetical protein
MPKIVSRETLIKSYFCPDISLAISLAISLSIRQKLREIMLFV